MELRRAWIALSLLALVGCASSRSSSESSVPAESVEEEDPFETDEEFEYEGSVVQEIVECQLWDEACMSRVQDIRHHRANEAKLTELQRAIEQAQQEQREQHEETIRTIKRAAGLDPNAGAGFWCFSAESDGATLVECRRSWDDCADQILRREREGMTVQSRRCEEYAQAACFRITRNLQEGERAMCYGNVATCERMQRLARPEGLVSPPTACGITD